MASAPVKHRNELDKKTFYPNDHPTLKQIFSRLALHVKIFNLTPYHRIMGCFLDKQLAAVELGKNRSDNATATLPHIVRG